MGRVDLEGGPHADAGITGRKIIDTYGGWVVMVAVHSVKDPSKVCSAAYAARWAANMWLPPVGKTL